MRTFKIRLGIEKVSSGMPRQKGAKVHSENTCARVDLWDTACKEDFVAGDQLSVRMMLAGIVKDSLG